MTRDELVAAGAAAVTAEWDDRVQAAAVIDAVEPLIRADEREKFYRVEVFEDTDGERSMRVVKGEQVGQNEWAASIRRDVLAELRAKVEELPVVLVDTRFDPASDPIYVRAVILSDVLALIDGVSDE